jgi:alpha-galactosidase
MIIDNCIGMAEVQLSKLSEKHSFSQCIAVKQSDAVLVKDTQIWVNALFVQSDESEPGNTSQCNQYCNIMSNIQSLHLS